jgi:hypothetical protein
MEKEATLFIPSFILRQKTGTMPTQTSQAIEVSTMIN